MKKLMSVLDNLNLNTKQKENLINVLNDHIEEKINRSPKIVILDVESSINSDGKAITTINNIHPQTVTGDLLAKGVLRFSFVDDFYKEFQDNIVLIKYKSISGTRMYNVANIRLDDTSTNNISLDVYFYMDGEEVVLIFN